MAALALMGLAASSASAGLGPIGAFSGPGSADGELAAPKRVAIHDATGNAFVVDQGNNRVQVFAPDGDGASYLTQFGAGTLDAPFGIAIDQDTGDVYVSDSSNGRVVKFNTDDAPTPTFIVDGGFGSPPEAAALAFDQAADDLLVVDPTGDVVRRYDPTGAATGASINGMSSPGGRFTGLLDVAVDSTGDVVVVDTPTGSVDDLISSGESRVERFSAAGAHEATYGPIAGGAGLVATDADDDRVLVGGNFQSWGNSGQLTVDVFEADGMAVSTAKLPAETVYGTVGGLAAQGGGSDRAVAITDQYQGYGAVSGHVLADVPAPTASIDPATDTAEFSATANGSVDPQGSETTYRFEYSVQGSGEWVLAADQGPVSDPGTVEADLTGLVPSTTYDVRLVATNAGGSDTTATESFTTLAADPPATTVNPAADVTGESASLSGTVDPQGHATSYRLDYQLDTDTDWTEVPGSAGDAGDGTDPVDVEADLSGLQPNTGYRYRIVATNGAGASESGSEQFATEAVEPTVITRTAVDRTTTTLTLPGRVNPNNSQTSYWFEHGPDTGYGNRIPIAGEDADAGAGNSPVDVTQQLTGLAPGQTVHYRIVAQNQAGTANGDDRTATTDAETAPACPNAEFRTGASARLSDCRAYEMVSPADKNGLPVYSTSGQALGLTMAANDGNAAIFTSWGVFAGSPSGLPASYRSVRGASGWVTRGASPAPVTPDPQSVGDPYNSVWTVAGRDLDRGAIDTRDGLDPTDQNDKGDAYTVEPDGTVALAARGNGAERTGASGSAIKGLSGDGTHVVFETEAHLVPEDAVRAAGREIYVRTGGKTQLINQVDGGGAPVNRCGSTLGDRTAGGRNAISSDGRRIIFTTPYYGAAGHPDCDQPPEVYMRVDNEQTIHVSASQRSAPDPGETVGKQYVGASSDASIVFFASSERLTDDAGADGCLYRYRVTTASLECIIDLLGVNVSKISGDGSRVYFTSYFPLTPGAVFGNRNLYVYDRGTIKFIGSDGAGAGLDQVIDGNESLRTAVVTPNGRYFLFVAYTRLTSFDNQGRKAVYLYDATEEELKCLSCDPAGQRPSGSTVRSDAELTRLIRHVAAVPYFFDEQTPLITDDGGTVVFETGDRLVPDDTNLQNDVYSFTGGRLSLISGGRGQGASSVVGMAAGGRDVFFVTSDSLVATDVDGGNADMYTARIGGGFHYEAPEADVPCAGDACQGGVGSQPRLAAPGSSEFSSPSFDPSQRGSAAKVRLSGARLVRGASATVRVRVPRRGRIRLSGPGLRSTSKPVGRAGAYKVRVRLSKASRRKLARGQAVKVRLSVRFTARAGGGSRASLSVTFKPKSEGSRRATATSKSKGSN